MGKNERGQVGVVVAILMVSLFVAVIVLVQVYYVPNWMKDREADHMDTVANQFSQIKASIDIETMAQRDISLINSVTLGSKELPFFVSARAFGSLNILSTTSSNFEVDISGDGLPATTMSEEGKTGGNLTNVISLSCFDLELDNAEPGNYFNASMGISYLNLSVSRYSTDYLELNFRVGNVSQTAVFDKPIAWIPGNATYTVNLLSDDYKFATRILPYLSTPFSINLTCQGGGAFSVRGSQYFGDMENEDITNPKAMGTIEYSSENAYFVDQTYIYEGGAVILNQSQGQAVISAPSISIQNVTEGVDPVHVCSLTLVDVNGLTGKTSVSGYGTYSIKTNYTAMQEDSAIASTLTFNITTNYVSAWERYMENLLNQSSITNFVITGNESENRVAITLNGPQLGGDGISDIKLTVTKVTITAQVGPGWVS